jgi:hypothetical protein
MKRTMRSGILAIAILPLLSGCVASIGSDGQHVHNPTLGQQLVDLKTAHDNGAINDDEYRAQREKLLEAK